MTATAPSEWGQRLSDRLRDALDAGDLASARRLALEGDGQARSLEKEYVLMYRGLGITIRVLLRLVGERPARAGLVPLLRRLRGDMLGLMDGAFASPESRRVIDDLRGGAAAPPAGAPPAELDRTERLLGAAGGCFDAAHGARARGGRPATR